MDVTISANGELLQPTYNCGAYGPSVNLDHGERFAVHTLQDDFDSHRGTEKKPRCKVCRP